MQISTVIEFRAASTVCVTGGGIVGQAMAAFFASQGHSVAFSAAQSAPKWCETVEPGTGTRLIPLRFSTSDAGDDIAQSDALIVTCDGSEYGDFIECHAQHLRGGHTVFLVDAPVCAAFEFGFRLRRVRSDISIAIVEVDSPFHDYACIGDKLVLTEPRKVVRLAGRTINETRSGLSAAASFWNGLMPASNVLERAINRFDLIARVCALMVTSLNGQTVLANTCPLMSGQGKSLIAALHDEMRRLARSYHVPFDVELPQGPPAPKADGVDELTRLVTEHLVPLSELAQLARCQMPVLDAIISICAVMNGANLKQNARTLNNIGIVGLDFSEVVEFVSA